MAEISDSFIALPGGIGTLEEIFEQWCWSMLGIHRKPCGFLNIGGFWEPLRGMITCIEKEGFMSADAAAVAPFADTLAELLAFFRDYVPPAERWETSFASL